MADELMVREGTGSEEPVYIPSQYSTLSAMGGDMRKVVANATNSAESLAEHEGEVLNVIGIICKPGVRRARTREDTDHPCTDTLIICEDGRAFFSKSEGVRRAADNFVSLGIFEDGEVVPMRMESKTIPGGNTMKTLVLV